MIKPSSGTRSKLFCCSLKWLYLICFCGAGLAHGASLRKRWEETGLSPLLAKAVNEDGIHPTTVAQLPRHDYIHESSPVQHIDPSGLLTLEAQPMEAYVAQSLANRGLRQFFDYRYDKWLRKTRTSSQPPDRSLYQYNHNSQVQDSLNSKHITPQTVSPILEPDYEGWIPGPEYVTHSTKKPRLTPPEGSASSILKEKSPSKSSKRLPPPVPTSLDPGTNPKTSFGTYDELDSWLLSDSNTRATSVAADMTSQPHELSDFVPSPPHVQPNPFHQDTFAKSHLTIHPPDFTPSMEPSLQHGPQTPQYQEQVLQSSPTTITYTPNSAVSHGTDLISPTQFQKGKTSSFQDEKEGVGYKPSVSSDSQFQLYNTARNSPEVVSHDHEQFRTPQPSESVSYPGNPSNLTPESPSTLVATTALRSFHIALHIAQSLARDTESAVGKSKAAGFLPGIDITHTLAPTIYDNLIKKVSEKDLRWVLLSFMRQHLHQGSSPEDQAASMFWLTGHLGIDRRIPIISDTTQSIGNSYSGFLKEWSEKLFSEWQAEALEGSPGAYLNKLYFEARSQSLATLAKTYAGKSLPPYLAESLRQGEMTQQQTVEILLATLRIFPSLKRYWSEELVKRLQAAEARMLGRS